jgi:hypothetical protein
MSHNEELHMLYSSTNIISQIKSRRMWWAGHVARMGEERKVNRVLWESQKERAHLKDQGVDGRMGSEWMLKETGWGSVEWIQLAQDRDRWSFANTVMNLRVQAPRV